MYYVGIDIAKNFHVASAINNHDAMHLKALTFKNNLTGFSKFIDSIYDPLKEELLISLEYTVYFGEVFTQFIFKPWL